VWKIVGYISQKPEKQYQVRKLDGSIPMSTEERMAEWRKLFLQLVKHDINLIFLQLVKQQKCQNANKK
jgi:hypothetical protein